MKSTLKALLVLIAVFSFSVTSAQVKDSITRLDTASRSRDTVTHSPSGLEITTNVAEYVYFKNGILMLHTDVGDNEKLLRTYNCVDGTTVTADGFYTPLDGAIIKLRDGDKVYKDGRIDFAH